MRAPNPNGCYVMLFERPEFTGASDLLNGPGKWPNLEGLHETNHGRWRDRLRSLRIGPNATVTVFTQPQFRGHSQEYRAGADHPNLRPDISAHVQSLTIACALPTPTS
jgi:hypothetical protein